MSLTDMTPDEYRKMLLLGAVEKGGKLKKHFSQAIAALEHFEYAEDFLKTIPPGAEEMFGGEIASYCESAKEILGNVRGALVMAYLAFAEPDILDGYLTTTEALCDKTQEEFYTCFEVKLTVVPDVLIIKMPQLWSRYSRQYGVPKWLIPRDNLPWFQWELERVLQNNLEKIPSYPQRHFSYIHVLSPSQNQYPDNDNYDTKKVTDIVTSYMGGTDSALRTSFSSFSMRSEKLDPGTYLLVSNSFNTPPALPLLQQILEQIFLTERTEPPAKISEE